jgi:hypothetical protein
MEPAPKLKLSSTMCVMDENQLSIENLNKIPLFDDRTDDNYLQNYEALEALKTEFYRHIQAWISIAGVGVAAMLAPQVAVPYMVAFGGVLLTKEYTVRLTRLIDVIKALLEAYGDDGIIITPRVKTDSATIDLFVRMPDKRVFVFMLRTGSKESTIIWREDIQQFRMRKKGQKSQKRCSSLDKAIEELNTFIDLKRDKHPLMGVTSAERKAPLMKAVVLSQQARISESNPSEALVSFGNAARVLKIATSSTTYVVESKDLVDFLANPKK